LDDLTVTPVPRPISLKNASIDVIRHFAPEVVIGGEAHGTVKGTVAHVRAPLDSVERDQETAIPAWIVFPKYVPGARARLQPQSKGKSFMRIANSSHTYSTLGVPGFETVAGVIDTCDCYNFSYSDLDQAVSLFDKLKSGAESVFAPASA
jgi:HprK-related kinase A